MSDGFGQRRPETKGPGAASGGWLALDDDELLYQIESLPPDHAWDAELLAVVRSRRHFFVRQEAAKRVRDTTLLKLFESDRHIGQILVRQMTRTDDAGYLEALLQRSRHIEVRNAAVAQLRLIRRQRTEDPPRPGDGVNPD